MVIAGDGKEISPSDRSRVGVRLRCRWHHVCLDRFDSRADSKVSGIAVLNDWGFFDLSGSTPEFLLDASHDPNILRTGASFRVVREVEEKPATRASLQP